DAGLDRHGHRGRDRPRGRISTGGKRRRRPRGEIHRGAPLEVDSHHGERPSPLAGAVANVTGAHLLVETERIRLGFPLHHFCASPARVLGGVTEQPPAHALSDPLRLYPEILEPRRPALGNQRRPRNDISFELRDEHRQLAQPFRTEVPAVGPFAHELRLVAPEALRRDRDLLQALTLAGLSRSDDDSFFFSHNAFLTANTSQSLLK